MSEEKWDIFVDGVLKITCVESAIPLVISGLYYNGNYVEHTVSICKVEDYETVHCENGETYIVK